MDSDFRRCSTRTRSHSSSSLYCFTTAKHQQKKTVQFLRFSMTHHFNRSVPTLLLCIHLLLPLLYWGYLVSPEKHATDCTKDCNHFDKASDRRCVFLVVLLAIVSRSGTLVVVVFSCCNISRLGWMRLKANPRCQTRNNRSEQCSSAECSSLIIN